MVDFLSYFVLILTCVIPTIVIFKTYKSSRANAPLPPTPFRLPVIGNLHLLGPIIHQHFHKLSFKYGPVFRLFLGSTPCIVVSSAKVVEEIYRESENVFLRRPPIAANYNVTYGGKGFIFAPYGSYWKFVKKITMSQLLSGNTLDILLQVRRDEINHFIKNLSRKAKVGKSVEIEVMLGNVTSNMISRMVTGNKYAEEDDEVGDIMKIMADVDKLYGKLNLSDHIWFFKNIDLQGIEKTSMDIRKRFDALMDKILIEHEEAREQNIETRKVKDLLNILLEISEDDHMEIKLTRDNIKALILDIFLAGTDTSSKTIEWALAELINHPNIMKKAVEEIDQVVGKNRLLQESDIPNLPYLQSIVKETLRLHPVAPMIQRLSSEDCIVGGYHIPANTTTFINLWSLGRDPTYWERPLEFRPERFEDKQIDVRGQNFHFLPFGSGRRMCPGTTLGLMFVYTILGSMIQCFTWKAGKYGNLTSVDMEEGVAITLRRANPLVCAPTTRLDLDLLLS
ncbi:hypothetical protein E3N88_32583 [Mikania micrantha]|uniref:Cytochrome P450 n=1 Tax=Mikania micrantha TaxID=192012 RepID=A0A5N6M9K7_9ASTR|nr:hypothetical protein E3N88_32583 [Mikania micrantha]